MMPRPAEGPRLKTIDFAGCMLDSDSESGPLTEEKPRSDAVGEPSTQRPVALQVVTRHNSVVSLHAFVLACYVKLQALAGSNGGFFIRRWGVRLSLQSVLSESMIGYDCVPASNSFKFQAHDAPAARHGMRSHQLRRLSFKHWRAST